MSERTRGVSRRASAATARALGSTSVSSRRCGACDPSPARSDRAAWPRCARATRRMLATEGLRHFAPRSGRRSAEFVNELRFPGCAGERKRGRAGRASPSARRQSGARRRTGFRAGGCREPVAAIDRVIASERGGSSALRRQLGRICALLDHRARSRRRRAARFATDVQSNSASSHARTIHAAEHRHRLRRQAGLRLRTSCRRAPSRPRLRRDICCVTFPRPVARSRCTSRDVRRAARIRHPGRGADRRRYARRMRRRHRAQRLSRSLSCTPCAVGGGIARGDLVGEITRAMRTGEAAHV